MQPPGRWAAGGVNEHQNNATSSSSFRFAASSHRQPFIPQLQRLVALHNEEQAAQQPSAPAYTQPTASRSVPRHQGFATSTNSTTPSVSLVPVTELPDRLRVAFNFPLFNAIQSTCFQTVYRSDENVAVSAPTGSGKTVIFELAIMRMLATGDPQAKAVYVAPTKALCTERANDWIKRLQPLDCPVVELTGDTDRTAFSAARKARVIVTTPEKWDSLTRLWSIYAKILDHLVLFLVDEVHMLHEKERGARLETIVARTQTLGKDVRFLAVSATVPNLCDIAAWIGSRRGESSAAMFEFGDEYRPCPLERHVYGYHSRGDEWSFQSTLNSKLYEMLSRHAHGKAALIFVPTRKATVQAAQAVKQAYQSATSRAWPAPTSAANFADASLQALAQDGVAFHHAGLSLEDRRLVEREFLDGSISVLCCTSTLAVGINLPAYCVIIRGTKRYEDGQWKEVSELDILQMLGRAGRPQYDRQGQAVILTEQSRRDYYEQLAGGTTVIESTLHLNLVEMINSEVGLRNGKCTVAQLLALLQRTFLFVRMQANPLHYMIEGDTRGNCPPHETLDTLCREALAKLREHDLVATKHDSLALTEIGDILLKTCVSFDTLLMLLKMQSAKLSDLLSTIAQAREFSDFRLRAEEKQFFSNLRTDVEIRYPPPKVATVADKVNLSIQAALAGISVQSESQDVFAILKAAPRIVKAALDVAITHGDAVTLRSCLELLRSLNGKAWDKSAVVLSQLPGIGEKSVKVLASSGIHHYSDVVRAEPHRLELLLKRNPPFGSTLRDEAASLPDIGIDVEEAAPARMESATGLVVVTVQITVYGNKCPRPGVERRHKSKRDKHPWHFCVLTTASAGEGADDFVDFRRAPLKGLYDKETKQGAAPFRLECRFKPRAGHYKVSIAASCEDVAGSEARVDYDCDVDSGILPAEDLAIATASLAHDKLITPAGSSSLDEEDEYRMAAAAEEAEAEALAQAQDATGESSKQTEEEAEQSEKPKQQRGKKKKRTLTAAEEEAVVGNLQQFINKSRQHGTRAEDTPARPAAPTTTKKRAGSAVGRKPNARRTAGGKVTTPIRPARGAAPATPTRDLSDEIGDVPSPPSPGRILKYAKDAELEAMRREAEAEVLAEEAKQLGRKKRQIFTQRAQEQQETTQSDGIGTMAVDEPRDGLHSSSNDGFDNDIDWSLVGDESAVQRGDDAADGPHRARTPSEDKKKAKRTNSSRLFLRSSSDAQQTSSEAGRLDDQEYGEELLDDMPAYDLVDEPDQGVRRSPARRRDEEPSPVAAAAASPFIHPPAANVNNDEVMARPPSVCASATGPSSPSTSDVEVPAHTLVDGSSDDGGDFLARAHKRQKQMRGGHGSAMTAALPDLGGSTSSTGVAGFDDSEEAWDRYLAEHVE